MVCAQHRVAPVDAAPSPRGGGLCNDAMLFPHFFVQTAEPECAGLQLGEPVVNLWCAVHPDS
jgi:hypothetical protein